MKSSCNSHWILLLTLATSLSSPAAANNNPKPRWAKTVDVVSEAITPAVDADGNTFTAGDGLSVFKFKHNGRLLWSTNLGNGVSASAVAVDRHGNVLVTGSQYDYASSPTNFADIWTFKFSPRGHLLWQQRFDSDDHTADVANRVATDQAGNAYVVGRSYNTTIPGAYSTILKYSPDGTLLWARRYLGLTNGTLNTSSMALDAAGNVAAISDLGAVSYSSEGNFRWVWEGLALQVGDFDPQGNLFTGVPLTKISPTGTVLWTALYTNPANTISFPPEIKADGSGNVLVALDSPVHCIVDDGDLDCETTPVILKYNPDGQLLWASRFSLATNQFAETRGLAVNAQGDSFLTASAVNDDSDTGYGLIARCDAAGNQIWSATYRPADTNHGNFFFQRLALAPHNNVIIYATLPFDQKVILLQYHAKRSGALPRITAPPAAQAVAAGSQASFQVSTKGPGHLRYQWYFNGALVPGATNSILNLPAVSVAQAGDYSVTVRNQAGEVTTPVARLRVE